MKERQAKMRIFGVAVLLIANLLFASQSTGASTDTVLIVPSKGANPLVQLAANEMNTYLERMYRNESFVRGSAVVGKGRMILPGTLAPPIRIVTKNVDKYIENGVCARNLVQPGLHAGSFRPHEVLFIKDSFSSI